mmetsp:Transcript_24616/g.59363  ORF Transcript_24616/g.59363 Transcript_24616/m.59363 type:complete len:1149 (+) Transcript_24616:113-3559(+)
MATPFYYRQEKLTHGEYSAASHPAKKSLSTLSYALALLQVILFNFTTQHYYFIVPLNDFPGCNALSSVPLSPRRTYSDWRTQSQPYSRRYHQCQYSCWLSSLPPISYYSSNLFSQETQTIEERRSKPDVTPFNHDIARTLFAPLFFSLYYDKNNDQSSSFTRHHYERPSPFKDPGCALTAERMLHRMMENRIRSEGRTVCPDGRTFSLVAGAFGRLRCGSFGSRPRRKVDQKMVTWEEEPNINPLHNAPYTKEVGQEKIQVTPIHKLQQILQLQLQLCHWEGWPTDIFPSVDVYNRVLKRLARQSGRFRTHADGDQVSTAEQAWLWLQLMNSPLPQNHITDDETAILCRPDAMSYMHVIEALSAHRAPVLSEYDKLHSTYVKNRAAVSAYESIDTLASQIEIDLIESKKRPTDLSPEWFLSEAESLLVIIENEYGKSIADNDGDHVSSLKCSLARAYRYLLEGWGRYAVTGVSIDSDGSNAKEPKNSREHAIKRSHELLRRLETLISSRQSEDLLSSMPEATVVPSSCYSSVMLALSVSNKSSAANAAEDVLQRMMSQYGVETSDFNKLALPMSVFNVKDLATAFSGCIAAHAKNNDAPKAERILNQIVDLYYDGKLGDDFVPEVRAFGTCIALWGKYNPEDVIHSRSRQRPKYSGKKQVPSHSQRLHNADRAEAILSQLEDVAEKNESSKTNDKVVLHATPYNIAILARVKTITGNSRAPLKSNKYNYDDNEENEQIILHAQSILDHMEYEMGVTPDPYTYSILLHAWCQQSRPGNENAADYAEELLRRRVEDVDISKIYGDEMAAESSIETTRSEIWPNVKHYSSVLKAHAKTKSVGGAKKALALLSEMEQRFYDADVIKGGSDTDVSAEYHVDQKDVAQPDLICYSIVIDAFANSRLPEASSVAHRLLQAVETKYDAGDVSMMPNTRVYTAVILSLVHSPFLEDDESEREGKRINNPQRAWSILEQMKNNDASPNSFTYNYIINCAATQGARDDDQRISFEIALRAFQELRKASLLKEDANGCIADMCHPDSFTFAFMLKACNNLLPPGSLRTKVIAQTFNECCRSGYLNDAVLDRLWRGLSAEKFYELVDERPRSYPGKKTSFQNKSPIRADDLPMRWSRYCNSAKRRTRNGVNRDDTSWKRRE